MFSNRLNEVAQRTQPGVIAALKKLGAEYRAFRVANMIWARGSQQVIRAIAERADVARLYANPQVQLDVPAAPAFNMDTQVAYPRSQWDRMEYCQGQCAPGLGGGLSPARAWSSPGRIPATTGITRR